MATDLGYAVLKALWEQEWPVERTPGFRRILRPTGEFVVDGYGVSRERCEHVVRVADPVFDDIMESWRLFLLIDVLRAAGLEWPWPRNTG